MIVDQGIINIDMNKNSKIPKNSLRVLSQIDNLIDSYHGKIQKIYEQIDAKKYQKVKMNIKPDVGNNFTTQ